jgi:hypothetical protein
LLLKPGAAPWVMSNPFPLDRGDHRSIGARPEA